ncbi:MAG: alpha/beta hydrolase, partial [Cyanobium sp.]
MTAQPDARSQAAAEQPGWTFLGHPIHCLRRGPDAEAAPGGPAILLVHGFGASTDHWRFNIPVLARTHEVHAL